MKIYYPGLKEKCRESLELIWQDISEAAREHGYTLAVHGSVARDIDLIAVPWTEFQTSSPEKLAEAIRAAAEKATGFAFFSKADKNPEQKPHGRLAWAIHLMGGPYLDLSIMPTIPTVPTTET